MNYINPKSTVGCIIYKEDKILLVKRAQDPFKNYWSLPGGHAELFEKVEEAVKREIKEELELKINPKFFCFDQEISRKLKWHANVFIFKSELKGIPRLNKDENSDYKFFSEAKIKKLKLSFNHKKILIKFFKNEKYKPSYKNFKNKE
ncbi:NUDIX hydrolase [Candidatus Woesearchaeota archaeon]|nr:NUDIX hydrolase [Candidatus Woesearchaeota archaeon]